MWSPDVTGECTLSEITLHTARGNEVSLSVVVCTYNRADLLKRLLTSLSRMQADPKDYEVIVVDNNSTDDTMRVTEPFCQSNPHFRYVFEIRQGLSHARNRGWQEARGEYVAYLDDECTVLENWVTVALELTRAPAADVFGGPYFGDHLQSPPVWWQSTYESYQLSETARFLNEGEFIRGANLLIRKSILEASHGFDTDLGMKGDDAAYGEETEWQRRYRKNTKNPTIYYDPKLFVYHLVRKEKYDLRYMLQSRFLGGRHIYSVFWASSPGSRRRWRISLVGEAALTLVRMAVGLTWSLGVRDRRKYPFVRNFFYERSLNSIEHLGFLYERFHQS